MQGINNKHLLTIKLLEETFKSHSEIPKDKIILAIDTILGLNLSDELMAQFIISACKKTNTGMFSLTYSDRLDNVIINGNREQLIALVATPFFPELFDNNALNDTEFKNVSRFVRIEYRSILALLKRGSKLITTSLVNLFEPVTDYQVDLATEGEVKKGAGIYTKCHEEICYYDIGEENPPPSYVESKIIVPDLSKDYDIPLVHCFDRMEIIRSLASGSKNNPRTNKIMSDSAISLLTNKLHTEIKLYSWYLTHGKDHQVNVKKDSISRITRPVIN